MIMLASDVAQMLLQYSNGSFSLLICSGVGMACAGQPTNGSEMEGATTHGERGVMIIREEKG